MKKGACAKPGSFAPPQSKRLKKDGVKIIGLKSANSEDCLLNRSERVTPQRKASTPTLESSKASISPDISYILKNDDKSNTSKKQVNTIKHTKRNMLKTGAHEGTNLKDAVDFEYTRYLQSVFRNNLERTNAADIDENLAKVQRRIVEHEKILHQTTERLKNISFNKEIDLLHRLQNPNHGKVLETLDSSNCEEYMMTLQTKLDNVQNRLKVKNIELPQGGGDQLVKLMSETLAAFEDLKANHDIETPKVLEEIEKVNRNTVNTLAMCKEKLSTAENLLLTKSVLEISTQNEV